MLLRICFAALAFGPVVVAAQAVPHGSGTARTPDVGIAYLTYGTRSDAALPIIAVNGGPGLSHAYMVENDLWERVARHRFTVLYDQRGTGASKPLAAGASLAMEAQVADLEAVRAALKLERIALLGDSYGGVLAMAYTAAHPEHVARLILSDSPGPTMSGMVHLLPEVFPDIEEQTAAEGKAIGDPDKAARAGLRAHFRMIFYSPAKRDAYMAHMGDLGYEPAIARGVSKGISGGDMTAKISAFAMPTLVLSGRYDMNVAPLTAWRLAHTIPGAKIVFFEESGHLPAYEEPERYLQVLDEFLNGN